MDIITCDKFCSDRLWDVDSVGVKNAGFPLTKPMAVNIGLHNCATCDNVDRFLIGWMCFLSLNQQHQTTK